MTNAPRLGFCLPVTVHRIIDADTYVISVTWSDLQHTLRLKDCWAPEKDTRLGKEATAAAGRIIDDGIVRRVFIPIGDLEESKSLLRQMLAIGSRIVGELWSDDINVGDYLIDVGMATKTRTS